MKARQTNRTGNDEAGFDFIMKEASMFDLFSLFRKGPRSAVRSAPKADDCAMRTYACHRTLGRHWLERA